MTNYADLLNDDALSYVCRIITGKQFKDIYKKNIKAFQSIKPGFRPASLSDEDAYAFAIKNKDIGFVNTFLNVWIQDRLDEIDKYKENLMNVGKTSEEALIETLAHCVFSGEIAVYFTLVKEQPAPEYIALINYAINLMHASKEASLLSESSVTTRKAYEQQMKGLQEKHEEELVAINTANSEVQKSLSRTENDLAQLKEIQRNLEVELTGYRELSRHAIIEEKIEPAAGYEYMSLCRVYTDDSGKSRLLRLADIMQGEISATFSGDFPNYTRLYRNGDDGPSSNGFIGIWDWKVGPSWKDPTKDFIDAKYKDTIIPIVVIISDNCHNITELISSLKAGVSVDVAPLRMIYAFFNGNTYEGLFCDVNSTVLQSGKLYPKAGILKLPVFEFNKNDVLFYDSCAILGIFNLGMPVKIVRIKDPLETVKALILSRVTWSAMQQQGYIRNEYQQIKAFLSGLPTTELYEEISTSCDCGIDAAKQLVNDLLARADSFVAGTTIENNVMAQIIRNNEDLFKSCKKEIQAEWEEENGALLAAAQSTLSSIKDEENIHRKAADQKQEEYQQLEIKIAASKNIIEAQEHLAAEVEEKVLAKIKQARTNAAEFIAENAFIHLDTPAPVVVVPALSGENSNPILFHDGIVKEAEDLEINQDWKELLSTVQAELREAGIGDSSVVGLSALLYSAYIHRIPVLLAGPNGIEIAKAFSLAVKGRTPAILQCIGNLTPHAIELCEESETETVVIEQPFQHEWYASIVQLLSRRQKFYIAVHPFAEDLIIEPRGLINYCIPVLTEIFVEEQPTMNYVGGYITDDFEPFNNKSTDKHYNKLLKTLKINSLAKLNVQQIINDMHEMLQADQTDYDYLFLLYPLAYAVSGIAELKEYLDNAADDSKPSLKVHELIKQFTGEDE